MNDQPVSADERSSGLLSGISYYILIGIVVGVYAAWMSLAFNVVGALGVGEEPFKLLQVYATFFQGQEALMTDTNLGIVLALALMLHSATGAVVGTPLFVVYHRFFPGQTTVKRALNGVWLGVVMWVVNYYLILTWFQPLMLKWIAYQGEPKAYIVENIPWWVAALTHICFVEVVLLTQPGRSASPD